MFVKQNNNHLATPAASNADAPRVLSQVYGQHTQEFGLTIAFSILVFLFMSFKATDLASIVRKSPNLQSIYATVKPDNVSIIISLAAKEDREASVEQIAAGMRNEMEKSRGLVCQSLTTGSANTYLELRPISVSHRCTNNMKFLGAKNLINRK
ncbi:hypothetical protein [Desulfotomaculum sp. 1211_IL3151]|uniref:hypothetical protein n=1 Tax=Desulfotomaculum sp. 1211_IL3151 TaxID=3084055 RepID=UPI002FDA5D2F